MTASDKIPLEVETEMQIIANMLDYSQDYNWLDPKVYDIVISDALKLIKAATYARLEVMKKQT
jgi:hypothetical protein